MSYETSFAPELALILVEARVVGPRGAIAGLFVLDTGAVMTTVTPEMADSVGYHPRSGLRRSRVRSAIGEEEGYLVDVAEFTALQVTRRAFPVQVFDLGYGDIDGLVGMNFLRHLDYEIRSADGRILATPIAR